MNDLQLSILSDRYALDGETTWQQVARRVADNIGEDGNQRQEFYEILEPMFFVPGGRVLFASGNPASVSAYNCVVLPMPDDSRGGIIDRLGQWVETQARGAGVGINMSSLRPRGALIRGVQGKSSGPLAWMELFSTATHRVIQQGGSRRGAAMLILNDNHPDIMEFVKAKMTPGILLGANLSVNVSDQLIGAAEEDMDWDLRWNGEVYLTIRARDLWNAIIQSAWASGEPGIVFLDRANLLSNSWYCEELIATNPCAEQPLGAYGACLLGSINLPKFVKSNGEWDSLHLWDVTAKAVKMLDNVIDHAHYPLGEIEIAQKRLRRIGIGTMGLADALLDMELRYGEPEAVEATSQVFKDIKASAYGESAEIAKVKGSFPAYDERWLNSAFVDRMSPKYKAKVAETGVRNCFLTSQAPTGTIAKLAGVWSGIEPYYGKTTYLANRLGVHEVVAPDSPYLVTAGEISPEGHIDMMAAVQEHVDSAVSKTVNAPEDHTIEDTAKTYRLAFDMGLKSVAYYRDKSRETQVQWSSRKDAENAKLEWEDQGMNCDLTGQCG